MAKSPVQHTGEERAAQTPAPKRSCSSLATYILSILPAGWSGRDDQEPTQQSKKATLAAMKQYEELTKTIEEAKSAEWLALDAITPAKRKRDWDELNAAIAPQEDGNQSSVKKPRTFSSVRSDLLPERFTPVDPVEDGEFHALMATPLPPVSDVLLNGLVKAFFMKAWAYGDYSLSSESLCVQFLGGLFEHLVYSFRTAENAKTPDFKRMKLAGQTSLRGERVRADGVVDFLFANGTRRVCVVEAKDRSLEHSTAQCVLAMEVLADKDPKARETAYGVVTNFKKWRFLKRSDDRVEKFDASIDCFATVVELRAGIHDVAARMLAVLDG